MRRGRRRSPSYFRAAKLASARTVLSAHLRLPEYPRSADSRAPNRRLKGHIRRHDDRNPSTSSARGATSIAPIDLWGLRVLANESTCAFRPERSTDDRGGSSRTLHRTSELGRRENRRPVGHNKASPGEDR